MAINEQSRLDAIMYQRTAARGYEQWVAHREALLAATLPEERTRLTWQTRDWQNYTEERYARARDCMGIEEWH